MFTENNNIKKACFTRFLMYFALLFLVTPIQGKNISKYYISSMQENGILYFILPQKGFEDKKSGSSLIYDITYLTTKDSVTFNFSYLDKSEKAIDSIALIYEDKQIRSLVQKIFIETKKEKWNYRYSSNFSYTDIVHFFNQKGNGKIRLYTQQEEVNLCIGKKKWGKISEVTNKILKLISYNK